MHTRPEDVHAEALREVEARRARLADAKSKPPWTAYNGDLWRGDVGRVLAEYDALSAEEVDERLWPYAEALWPDSLGNLFHGDPVHPEDMPLIADAVNTYSAATEGAASMLDIHTIGRIPPDEENPDELVTCEGCPLEVDWPCDEWLAAVRTVGLHWPPVTPHRSQAR